MPVPSSPRGIVLAAGIALLLLVAATYAAITLVAIWRRRGVVQVPVFREPLSSRHNHVHVSALAPSFAQAGASMVEFAAGIRMVQHRMRFHGQRVAHRWRLLMIKMGPKWIDADPPTWLFPDFANFRTRPFDQEID